MKRVQSQQQPAAASHGSSGSRGSRKLQTLQLTQEAEKWAWIMPLTKF